jgi:hypothetical protein
VQNATETGVRLLLKVANGCRSQTIDAPPPVITEDGDLEWEVEAILDHRIFKNGHNGICFCFEMELLTTACLDST